MAGRKGLFGKAGGSSRKIQAATDGGRGAVGADYPGPARSEWALSGGVLFEGSPAVCAGPFDGDAAGGEINVPTMAAKVKYLVEKKHIDPSEIISTRKKNVPIWSH